MADSTLTLRQIEALKAAFDAGLMLDGWLKRSFWNAPPMTIKALVRKGLLERHLRHAKVRLTAKGRALVESDPERFGVTVRRLP